MHGPRPGSLTSGCSKLAAPAWRAMMAPNESRWPCSTRQPSVNPAVSESPIWTKIVKSTCAAAGDVTTAARAAAEVMRKRAFGVFMFFRAPSERQFERGAWQDRERLVRGAEVVLARRNRPLVEPEEEARDLELEVLRQGDPGPDRAARAVRVRQDNSDVGVRLRRLVVDEAARDPAAGRAAPVGQARANGPRVHPVVHQGLVGKAVDLEDGLVEDAPRRVVPVRFECQVRADL